MSAAPIRPLAIVVAVVMVRDVVLLGCVLASGRPKLISWIGMMITPVRVAVDLSAIPQTLPGNLGRRAAAARLGAPTDPRAINVVERLEYDFADSRRGGRLHAFWRVDNGQVRWLTVDLPETMDLRHRVLPDGPRQSSHRGSALDL